MKDLTHAELSMKELQTFSDSQAEDIEVWKGRVKALENTLRVRNGYMKVRMEELEYLEQENERLQEELSASDDFRI